MTTYEKIIQKGKQEGIQKGIQEGIQKGRQAGRQEGELQKNRQTIINMDEKGFNINLIAQVLEVSEDFVKTVLAEQKGA